VAQFKRGDFSTCVATRPGRPKTVTTPEIIDQIYELILKGLRISLKSIAEKLGISRERLGSIILEDLDMRKLSANWVPKCLNADKKRQRCQSSEQLLEFFLRDPNDFLTGAIGDHGRNLFISLLLETKQQSMEWRHSGSLRPKQFRVQKSLEKFSPRFFGFKTASSHWLSSKGPKYQRGVLLISAGAIEGHFEGKTLREVHQGGIVLARQCPGSPGTYNIFITHPILWIWPRRTTTCSLDWKINWKVAIFLPTRRSFLPRRPGWTDNILNFFEWLEKVRAMVYWASWGVCWLNPKFGRFSFFPSWSG